ncbi:hypothetical protein ACIHFD_04900 [Nonomuraea sp. NPDC051941]|uniref:hypothetical protein n=1 Tax=Nonomuraea sp. NPDC051941 TaxID=3364373 RepID=UPI0037C662AB
MMDDLSQPGPLSPPGEPSGATFVSDVIANQTEKAACLFEQRTDEKISAARRVFYAASAEAVFALQNGQRLSGEQSFAAAHAQASRAWWDLVDEEIAGKKLAPDHAVRRVRSWARHYLTGEPPAARPGTLFDHALAHAARIAARDFLNDSGHLLTQHLIDQAGNPVTAAPVEHDRPQLASPCTPPSTAAGPGPSSRPH